MPWNGSGVYTRVRDWTTDEANGVNPSATNFDQEGDDVATALNNCLTKDGQNQATGNINLGTNKLINVGTPTSSADAATKGYVDGATYLTAAGLSVFGRSSNSTGTMAAIVAANDGEVLRRSGTAVGFGTIATAGIADGAVTAAKLASGVGMPSGTANQSVAYNSSNVITAVGANIGVPGYRSTYWYDGLITSLTSNYFTVAANRLYAHPFVVGAFQTFDRINVRFGPTGTGNARLGIYNFANGLPTSLVADLGTIAVATSSDVALTISQALNPGVYALAVVFSATPEVAYTGATQLPAHWLGISSLGTGAHWGVYCSHTYGALPSSFGAATNTTNTATPVMVMRAA